MAATKSAELFKQAKQVIPGGVNSPVRAYKSVGGDPRFIARASGAKIYDVEGNEYIDYVASWGPLILGHAHPQVVGAVQAVAARGTSFGAPTEAEVELAQLIVEAVSSIERVRLVNSGTEATMSALRLARGFTGRDKVVKFAGCYHGHVDSLLVKAGSGAITLGVPDSAGIPASLAEATIIVPYNDLESVKQVFSKHGREIAAIIVEPIAGNMGVIPPKPGFLSGLREICNQYEALLIFDEVITGFRVAYGGAQQVYGVEPDLTCLGKIIGGGLPVGAYGGKAHIMDFVSPVGPVYQAGTLSGNPLAVTAGIQTLKLLKEPGLYSQLEENSAQLAQGFMDNARQRRIPAQLTRVGSMMCTFFTPTPVVDYTTARSSDTERFARYFWGLQQRGINIAPSQFETLFVSSAHTRQDIEKTIQAHYEVLEIV
jgi:glutamate-1-semialdehyde 2,1-aminomutase